MLLNGSPDRILLFISASRCATLSTCQIEIILSQCDLVLLLVTTIAQQGKEMLSSHQSCHMRA
jgi:hypothetical protein